MSFFEITAIIFDSMKLAKVREKNGLSQRELAKLSKVGHITIARIETGACDPRLSTLEKLAKALKVSVKDLLD